MYNIQCTFYKIHCSTATHAAKLVCLIMQGMGKDQGMGKV